MSNNNNNNMQSKFDMTTQRAAENAALKLGLSQAAQTANIVEQVLAGYKKSTTVA